MEAAALGLQRVQLGLTPHVHVVHHERAARTPRTPRAARAPCSPRTPYVSCTPRAARAARACPSCLPQALVRWCAGTVCRGARATRRKERQQHVRPHVRVVVLQGTGGSTRRAA